MAGDNNNNNIKNKLVYFNINNEKEKNILKWANENLIGFSGLVKQLLYREMIKEKRAEKDLGDF